MAILTRQHRLFPTSGNTLTVNGNPLHSRIGYDLVQGANNLHKTQPFFSYVAAPTADGTHIALAAAPGLDAQECFVAQYPTVVPDGMKRFCWTFGFYARALEGSGDYTIDFVTVYVSPYPYAAATAGDQAPTVSTDAAFDLSKLGGTYGMSPYATPISLPGLDATDVWNFIDMSAGTEGNLVPFDSKLAAGTSWLNEAHIIITMQATRGLGNTSDLEVRAASFSAWWEME